VLETAVADVMATYGAGVMYNPAYPTTDGCIPWALFWVLYGQIPRRLALERVQLTTAIMLGVGRLFGNEAAAQAAAEDIKRALP
jgi:hypothetical protein